MAVESIEALMIAIQTLYPVSYSEKQIPMVTDRYRTALSGISGAQLDEAWNKLALTWAKRTAPTAADILAACGHGGKSAANDPGSRGQPTRAAFDTKMKARDDKRNEERAQLIADYRRDHAQAYEQATAQGWLGQLEIQVQRAANMIAQRNEHRRAGAEVPKWKSEFCEGGSQRSDNFIPWFSITTTEDGVDLIEIERSTARVWIEQAKIPGPISRRPPSRSSTFTQADAALPMESSAA